MPPFILAPERHNVPAADLPQFHHDDFRNSYHWRIFRIMAEFVDGWQFVSDFKKTVTFFGSARLKPTNPWYREAVKLGSLVAKAGFSVVTGGGPGIMEAGNRGATESGRGDSIGLNIQLPMEQRANSYVQKGINFHYFFVRKVMLSYSAQAYVFFPGGFGTLDELTELITLIQTKKMPANIPVVLVGKEFWTPFLAWVEKTIYKEYDMISEKDMKIYQLVDSAEEAFRIVKKSTPRKEFR